MLAEEFTFPKLTSNTVSYFTISSSPWRNRSLVYPDYDCSGEGFSGKDFSCLESKTMCNIQQTSSLEDQVEERLPEASLESEEMMDMLWEKFNEELHGVSSMDEKKEAERLSGSGVGDFESKGGAAKFCILQNWKMSKASKRPNMLVLVTKILKKVFLPRIHKSAQIKHK